MITVRLPATLRTSGYETLEVEPVATLAALIEVLADRVPGFRGLFDDALLNFAVNDEIVLSGAGARPLHNGDTVEVIPALSGG